jgi:crotonobetainyl-CoA:carnitine CoA-transferase CaiB-like acyl-CoA transferase
VLGDLTVLEQTSGIAPAYCGRLLADLGARVIAIEPPGGTPLRREGPFPADANDAPCGGLYAYLGAGKESVTLDPEGGAYRALVAHVDVLIEEVSGAEIDRVRARYSAASGVNPALIMAAISPFGLSGPRRRWRATPLTLFALTSRMRLHGKPERQPLQYSIDTAPFQIGATAAAALATALARRDTSGHGSLVEVAGLEALIANVDVITILTSFTGVLSPRGLYASLTYPCKDGFMLLSFRDRDIAGILAAMGVSDSGSDPRFADRAAVAAHKDEFDALMLGWLLEQTRAEAFATLQAKHVMCAPVLDFVDVLQDPHYAVRCFFQQRDTDGLGRVTLPGNPFSPGDASFRSPPAVPGADTEAVLSDLLGRNGASDPPASMRPGAIHAG